jgi:hypothetical protein
MFLKEKKHDHLVEVLSLSDLFDPVCKTLVGRLHYGEELQDAQKFDKSGLLFPSGESLPACWLDVRYDDSHLLAISSSTVSTR